MEEASQTNREPSVRTARSRGYTISYEDEGEGTPIVLVASLNGSARQMRENGYVDRLAATRRVLNVDPLGHGRSEKPYEWEAYRNPEVAADVVAVLDAAGIARTALWGYSRGAWLACMVAIEYPHRVAALILGGGGNLLTTLPSPILPPFLAAFAQGDWGALWQGMGVTLSARLQRQFETNDPRAIAAAYTGHCRSGYVVDLSRVGVPTLVYCGARDHPRPTG